MTVEDGLQCFGEVGGGIYIVEFACRHDGREERPIFSPDLMACEECILSGECNHPFILPMSGRSWKSITGGTPILGIRCLYAKCRSERRANF